MPRSKEITITVTAAGGLRVGGDSLGVSSGDDLKGGSIEIG